MGIRADKALSIQLIQFQQKTRSITAAQAETFISMVQRCATTLELSKVKEVVRDVARGVTEHTEVNLLVMDPIDSLDEPEDPPELQAALAQARVTFKGAS